MRMNQINSLRSNQARHLPDKTQIEGSAAGKKLGLHAQCADAVGQPALFYEQHRGFTLASTKVIDQAQNDRFRPARLTAFAEEQNSSHPLTWSPDSPVVRIVL